MDHYYAELPFLHKPSLVMHPMPSAKLPVVQWHFSLGVLLAFHALTSHHESSESGNRFVTSDMYAQAALSQTDDTHSPNPLETIQTLLMVGNYYWVVRGNKSGIRHLKRAFKYFSSSGYLEGQNETINRGNDQAGPSGNLLEQILGRTFWSCFILDSLICWTEKLSREFKPHEVRIQLPTIEATFSRCRRINTRFLQDNDETYKERVKDTETNSEFREGAVSLLIRAVCLYGEIYELCTTQEWRYLWPYPKMILANPKQ
jgi:hypothetical protein